MRLFFALELLPAIAEALDAAIAPLRAVEPGLDWATPDKLHLTMKFIGDADEEGAKRLAGVADAVAARHHPFEMALEKVGAFPNFRRARVVWMGVEHEPRLELLHHDLEVACGDLGYEVEGRAFRPHITLARVRSPLPLDRARPLARAARGVTFAATSDVSRLTLFESALAPTGARHRRVHAALLNGR
jgi:2'-5' RNA ligase